MCSLLSISLRVLKRFSFMLEMVINHTLIPEFEHYYIKLPKTMKALRF